MRVWHGVRCLHGSYYQCVIACVCVCASRIGGHRSGGIGRDRVHLCSIELTDCVGSSSQANYPLRNAAMDDSIGGS